MIYSTKSVWILAGLMLLSTTLAAQSGLPTGTIIPVSLDTGLKADKAHVGQRVRAEVMQDIPGTAIRRRDHVLGHVVQATSSKNGKARIEFRFDAVDMRGQRIPLEVNLRALASFIEVGEAQVPEEGPARGTTPEVATTQQIGGDQVYRGGGPVAVGDTILGKPTPWGVLAVPRAKPGQPCGGALDGNTKPQALWLFSTDACGIYGFQHLRIEHAGRTEPIGNIVIVAERGKINLVSGTGMLLRVRGS